MRLSASYLLLQLDANDQELDVRFNAMRHLSSKCFARHQSFGWPKQQPRIIAMRGVSLGRTACLENKLVAMSESMDAWWKSQWCRSACVNAEKKSAEPGGQQIRYISSCSPKSRLLVTTCYRCTTIAPSTLDMRKGWQSSRYATILSRRMPTTAELAWCMAL